MTDQTYKTDQKKHGGYRTLKSYQTTTLIYDLTVEFVDCYIDKFSRTRDQMVQAARSGRQNIAEGSQASATSKKTEIKLVGVARASLEELLIDYEDYLRQHKLKLWGKDSPEAQSIRALTYKSDNATRYKKRRDVIASYYKTYQTYQPYLKNAEKGANMTICLIHQANYLLDRQLQSLERSFIAEGGYSENLFRKRLEKRDKAY